MKVILIQMNILWGDIAGNCDVASQLIDSQPGADLYVLPEMFSTGFSTEPAETADANNTTLSWMQQKANETNAAICGSVSVCCNDDDDRFTYHNRFYFVKPQSEETHKNISPSGQGAYYDKHHLFSYGHEDENYTPGKDRVIVEWRGVRFLLQVCYDLRFPCFSRNIPKPTDKVYPPQAKEAYLQNSPFGGWGAIIYVASWPTTRIQVWHTLLKARALENQCYVFGVNRIGEDPACKYPGGTEAIDAYGHVVASCPDGEQSVITVDLDMDKLTAFRQKFPVLLDADSFDLRENSPCFLKGNI